MRAYSCPNGCSNGTSPGTCPVCGASMRPGRGAGTAARRLAAVLALAAVTAVAAAACTPSPPSVGSYYTPCPRGSYHGAGSSGEQVCTP